MTINNAGSIQVNQIDTSPTISGNMTSNLSPSQKFDGVMANVTGVASQIAGAIPIPGGAVMSAALSGASNMAANAAAGGGAGAIGGAAGGIGGALGGASGGTPNMQQMQTQMFNQNMYYMQLQQKFQSQNELFSTLSNIENLKHQTNNSIIQNIH